MSLEPNHPAPVIDGYDLVRCIGCGSFGDVWLVRNRATGQFKAVKFVYRDRFPANQTHFEREFAGLKD
jgi:serine/threonine protein kinase